MDPPDPFSAGGRPSPGNRSELQGPRPAPLKVNKDSYKIKKPPVAPPHPHHYSQLPPPLPPGNHQQQDPQNPQPVIIYAVSPKIIHVKSSDFMDLVQRLTGNSSTTTDTGGDVSPAARLASTERTSPSERDQRVSSTIAAAAASDSGDGDDEISRILEQTNIQMGQNIPSILSPAPATLPPISPSGLFSPMTTDPFMYQVSNMFIPSPSTLFSAPMASPSPSYHDLFTPFFDF